MESNKYDTDFRNKIDKREIAPSTNSWNRLEAMLDASEQKKRKPMTWLFIAAGILGFLLIGNLFFIGQGENDNQIQVVQQSQKPTLIEPIITKPNQEIFIKESVAELLPSNEIKKLSNKSRKSRIQNEKVDGEKVISMSKKELLAMVNPTLPSETEIKNSVPTDQNLSQLLIDASTNKRPNQKVKVSAKTLLSQVDGELDLTFREKIIQSAAKNYQNIKVAVVNRNYE